MFVQVIQGQGGDRAQLERLGQQWNEEIRPGAQGFLGGTMGVTDDGHYIVVARFESEETGRANSNRPEQGEWWSQLVKALDGEPQVAEGTDIDLMLGGGSDEAGFVQVMTGRAKDRDAFTSMEKTFEERASEVRPDLLGSLRLWHGDNRFIEVIYFTSEADAREGESKPVPDDMAADMGRWQEQIEDLRYFDLRQPQLI